MRGERPNPTGALIVGFLLVLLCWSLLAGSLTAIELTTTDATAKEAADKLGVFFLMGLIGCVAATLWLANLVNRVVTDKNL